MTSAKAAADAVAPEPADLPADPPPPETASLKARSSSGVLWGLVDSLSQQILSMAVFIVLGRILSPGLFGIVSTALVFVFLMRSTILNAVSTALVTLRKPVAADYDTAFWILLAISGTAVLILNVAAGPLARLYRIPEFADVIRATSVIVLIFGLSYAHVGWARRNFQFKALALRNVIGVVAGGVGGIALALLGYGIAALVVNQVLAGVVSLFLLWRSIPWRPRLQFSRERARPILATALPLGLTQGLQFAVQNFDTALVTYLLGPIAGGLYAAAKRITLAIQLAVWQPISGVSLPAFAEVMDDGERLGRVSVKTATLVMAVTVPLFVAVALSAPSLIVVLFGSHWAGAAPLLAILGLFGIVSPSVGVLHQIVLAKQRAKFVLYFTLLQSALALGAVFLFGGRSAVAVALCLSAPALVTYALTLILVGRMMPFPTARYLIGVGRPLFAGSLMAAAMLFVPDPHFGPLVRLIEQLAAGGLVYLAAMFLFARATLYEVVDFALGLLPKRFRRT